MPQLLPLEPSLFRYDFDTTLDGTEYLIEVRWNTREQAWFMTVSDVERNVLRRNIKLVLGTFPGARVADDRWPNGVFLLIDTTDQSLEATFDDLGTRVLLYFYPADELIA